MPYSVPCRHADADDGSGLLNITKLFLSQSLQSTQLNFHSVSTLQTLV